MDILFTADSTTFARIGVLLHSLRRNEPEKQIRIHLIWKELTIEQTFGFQMCCRRMGYEVQTYCADLLRGVPTCYLRLFASQFLPEDVRRVIFLDTDLLVIAPISPLWEMETSGAVFLAAPDADGTESMFHDTGVLVMELELLRLIMDEVRMIGLIEQALPVQKVFQRLFGHLTKTIPDEIWNYRADRYMLYCRRTNAVPGEMWVMRNTAILHFAGKSKPWDPHYRYRFGSLYLHYQMLAERMAVS